MGRILVIRGGALGDFILTLPAIRVLRDAFPEAHLEILGYPQFVNLAKVTGLADDTRCIEYARLAPFFARQTILDPELMEYFASFDVVVSYLFDPDRHFADNLKRSGVITHLRGIHKPAEGGAHAALQLAKPLESLALFAEESDLGGRLGIPTASGTCSDQSTTTLAIHPGSGSSAKNWPARRWIKLAEAAIATGRANEILLVTGEVEAANGTREELLAGLRDAVTLRHLDHAPITEVAAALSGCRAFVGNDSGITHLAGALGMPTIALFGPTDPQVWAPWGEKVHIISAGGPAIEKVELETVLEALAERS